jgi:membrane protease YdiL (CAAX protease family)
MARQPTVRQDAVMPTRRRVAGDRPRPHGMSGILRRYDHDTVPATATWGWREAIAVLLFAVGIGHLVRLLLLGATVTSPEEEVGRRLVAELIWIVVVLTWLRARHLEWTKAFGRPARTWSEVADGAVFGSILYGVVALCVGLPVSWLMGLALDRDVVLRKVLPPELSEGGWLLAGALALVIAPVAEELLFRGVLFPALRNRFGLVTGVAGSAAAFGFAHYLPGDPVDVVVTIAAATAMGVGLAIQYERRGTLVAPLSAHIAFNILGLAILLRP